MTTVRLRHNQVELVLHPLGGDGGRPLLALHGLGERAPATRPPWAEAWPGPVWGLDFTGHGASTVPGGGGYTAEILMGDADIALAHLGPSTVVGHGLGAYVALLIAGARPDLVLGAVIADGPGLAGGGTTPQSAALFGPAPGARLGVAPDPWALVELARDVRPPDYATSFARQAIGRSRFENPIAVCARWLPPWLEAVREEPGVVECPDVATALRLYR
jgi:pimeloyl-ACP methyl ester carboxylesterase